MRRVINKNLSEAEILRAAELMVGDGVESLKLYFMIGLPTETDDDLDGIVDLVDKIRRLMLGHGRVRGRVGRIKVSVNPFVPKPWTPFQWEPMAPVATAQRGLTRLRRAFARMANVEIEIESPREAYLQTLLSRGDRRVASVVESLARDDTGWWQQLQSMRRGTHASVRSIPTSSSPASTGGTKCFPGTSSIIASTSRISGPSGEKRSPSARPSPATSPPAGAAGPADGDRRDRGRRGRRRAHAGRVGGSARSPTPTARVHRRRASGMRPPAEAQRATLRLALRGQGSRLEGARPQHATRLCLARHRDLSQPGRRTGGALERPRG